VRLRLKFALKRRQTLRARDLSHRLRCWRCGHVLRLLPLQRVETAVEALEHLGQSINVAVGLERYRLLWRPRRRRGRCH
jgi:hypothetical protein